MWAQRFEEAGDQGRLSLPNQGGTKYHRAQNNIGILDDRSPLRNNLCVGSIARQSHVFHKHDIPPTSFTDDLLRVVLSALLDGLKPHNADYRMASQLALMQLFSKVQLSRAVMTKVFAKLVEVPHNVF